MPEATMNEDCLTAFSKYYIWLPGNILGMKTVSITHRIKHTANQHFWFRISPLYTRHACATGRRR